MMRELCEGDQQGRDDSGSWERTIATWEGEARELRPCQAELKNVQRR